MDLFNTAKDVFQGAKSLVETGVSQVAPFVPAVIDELAKDSRDIVRSGKLLLTHGAAGDMYDKAIDQGLKILNVKDEDIRDTDPKNHDVLDNAGALANSAFNIGTTVSGVGTGVKLAKNGISIAKKARTAVKGAKTVKQGLREGAEATVDYVKPSNWKHGRELEIHELPRSGHNYVELYPRDEHSVRFVSATAKDRSKMRSSSRITHVPSNKRVNTTAKRGFTAAKRDIRKGLQLLAESNPRPELRAMVAANAKPLYPGAEFVYKQLRDKNRRKKNK